jgi:hypothetical protein
VKNHYRVIACQGWPERLITFRQFPGIQNEANFVWAGFEIAAEGDRNEISTKLDVGRAGEVRK